MGNINILGKSQMEKEGIVIKKNEKKDVINKTVSTSKNNILHKIKHVKGDK